MVSVCDYKCMVAFKESLADEFCFVNNQILQKSSLSNKIVFMAAFSGEPWWRKEVFQVHHRRTCTANCSDAYKAPIVPKNHRHGKKIGEQYFLLIIRAWPDLFMRLGVVWHNISEITTHVRFFTGARKVKKNRDKEAGNRSDRTKEIDSRDFRNSLEILPS